MPETDTRRDPRVVSGTRRTLLAGGALAVAGTAAGVSRLRSSASVGSVGPTDAEPVSARSAPFRATDVTAVGHSWAAGVHVRRSRSWPSLVADRLDVPRPPIFPTDEADRRNFTWGNARATGPASNFGTGWILQSLPAGSEPAAASLVLLLTGDADIATYGQSAAARALMAGGIRSALGRVLATKLHEEDDAAAWSFEGSWRSQEGRQVNSGSGVRYATGGPATFTVRLPTSYDGSPVTVGLPIWDDTVSGSIAWDLDGRPLKLRTDLTALRDVLTRDAPSAVHAERFRGFARGAHALRGTWTPGPGRGSAVVVDHWSLERRDAQVVCPLMPANNPWGSTFGGITTSSNRANREALREYRNVTYVDLQEVVCPTGTRRDRRYWDSDQSSHPTAAGERAIAAAVYAAIRRIRVPR